MPSVADSAVPAVAASLLVGVGDLTGAEVLAASRIPRTLALILAGASRVTSSMPSVADSAVPAVEGSTKRFCATSCMTTLLALAAASLLVGVGDLTGAEVLAASRIPRTLALMTGAPGASRVTSSMPSVADSAVPAVEGSTKRFCATLAGLALLALAAASLLVGVGDLTGAEVLAASRIPRSRAACRASPIPPCRRSRARRSGSAPRAA
jgi:ABC-type enterochelin transport system permease subunit